MSGFPVDEQTLRLVQAAVALGPAAVGDLLADMDVGDEVVGLITALVAEVRSLRAAVQFQDAAVQRGRREALQRARDALVEELRGAPFDLPEPRFRTYVGGLARARRVLEEQFRVALVEEEQAVIDSAVSG